MNHVSELTECNSGTTQKCPFAVNTMSSKNNYLQQYRHNLYSRHTPTYHIIVGCSFTSELNRSINSEWEIFGLCHYCVQWAIHPANFHCRLYKIRQWTLRRSQLTPLKHFNNLLRLCIVTFSPVYAYNPQMASALFFRPYSKYIWHSEDRASWYILIIKANELYYFSDLFDKVLYMFRTCPLSIIGSIWALYTRSRYLSF